jgi:glycosyltransferase involved in cell wall biosynthesis
MKLNKVDVVIIGLNEALMLGECIESVRRYKDIGKIIYVDSGSHDDSVKIAMKLAHIVICSAKKPSLAAKSRNIGLSAVTSDYILFLDGDMKLKNSPAHFITSLDDKAIGIYGVRNDRFINKKKEEFDTFLNRYGTQILKPASHVGGAAIYKTSAIRSVGGFMEELRCYEEPRLLVDLTSKGFKVLESPIPFIDHFVLGKSRFKTKLKRSYQFGYFFGSCLLDAKMKSFFKTYPLVGLLYLDLFFLLTFIFSGSLFSLGIFTLLSLYLLVSKGMKKVAVNTLYAAFLPFSTIQYLVGRFLDFAMKGKLTHTA